MVNNGYLQMFSKVKVLIFVRLLKQVAKLSTNTIDDRLVAAVELALDGKDYGLQRKPTGPRSNKRTGNGKAKKA